jgi:hypothetical protein
LYKIANAPKTRVREEAITRNETNWSSRRVGEFSIMHFSMLCKNQIDNYSTSVDDDIWLIIENACGIDRWSVAQLAQLGLSWINKKNRNIGAIHFNVVPHFPTLILILYILF